MLRLHMIVQMILDNEQTHCLLPIEGMSIDDPVDVDTTTNAPTTGQTRCKGWC